MKKITWALVLCSSSIELLLAMKKEKRRNWYRTAVLLLLPMLAMAELLGRNWLGGIFDSFFPKVLLPTLLLGLVQGTLVIPSLLRLFHWLRHQIWFYNAPPGILGIGSFVLVIVVGAALLLTPNATTGGIGVLDAFFTSASAVCVTGLTTINVETDLTHTGQGILLSLIQIGGLGVMTLTYFLALVAGQGVNLRDRVALRDLLSEANLGRVGFFIWHILITTLVIELIGMFLLHHFWKTVYVGGDLIWWDSLFHAVSAFCNAGFSTYGDGLMHETVLGNRPFQAVIMGLIVLGGLGFALTTEVLSFSWQNLRRKLSRTAHLRPRLSVHSRLALLMTVFLLVGGTLAYRVAGIDWWTSLFNSVTMRTAGFNISNFAELGTFAILLSCVLMVIGGNPGGTAGGVKTTTFAIAFLELGRVLRGRRDLQLWDRRVSSGIVQRAAATMVLCFIWLIVAFLLVGYFEPEADFSDVIFECVSAFGTVGVSRGITADLSEGSKVVIILTMLAGRIGILTFALTFAGRSKPQHYRLPETRVNLS